MNQPVSDTLNLAAQLITRGWTTDAFARDHDSLQIDPSSPNACAWCVSGALQAAARRIEPSDSIRREEIYLRAARLLTYLLAPATQQPRDPEGFLICWNDDPDQTAAKVIYALRTTAGFNPQPEETP